MISLNRVIIAGSLTKTPLLHETASGKKFTSFTISAKDSWHTRDDVVVRSNLIPVVCWGKLAENVCKYLDQGKCIMAEGHLESDTFEKDGKKQIFVKVTACSVVFLERTGGSSKVIEE